MLISFDFSWFSRTFLSHFFEGLLEHVWNALPQVPGPQAVADKTSQSFFVTQVTQFFNKLLLPLVRQDFDANHRYLEKFQNRTWWRETSWDILTHLPCPTSICRNSVIPLYLWHITRRGRIERGEPLTLDVFIKESKHLDSAWDVQWFSCGSCGCNEVWLYAFSSVDWQGRNQRLLEMRVRIGRWTLHMMRRTIRLSFIWG